MLFYPFNKHYDLIYWKIYGKDSNVNGFKLCAILLLNIYQRWQFVNVPLFLTGSVPANERVTCTSSHTFNLFPENTLHKNFFTFHMDDFYFFGFSMFFWQLLIRRSNYVFVVNVTSRLHSGYNSIHKYLYENFTRYTGYTGYILLNKYIFFLNIL